MRGQVGPCRGSGGRRPRRGTAAGRHEGEGPPAPAPEPSDEAVSELPTRIGPCELGVLGAWVTVRCPRELAPLMRQAGGLWDPGGRFWLIHRRRMGPVIRELQRTTAPMFR